MFSFIADSDRVINGQCALGDSEARHRQSPDSQRPSRPVLGDAKFNGEHGGRRALYIGKHFSFVPTDLCNKHERTDLHYRIKCLLGAYIIVPSH